MTQRWTPATAWLVSRGPLDHCASRRGTCRGTPPTDLENVVSPNDQRSTLAEHAQRLRERTDAICRFSGGLPSFKEGLQVFRDSCDDFGFRLDPLIDLSKEPDARRDEHEVWFLLGNGWRRFQANGNTAWLDETRSLVVSDTHQGNLIQTGDGVLVPIDFRIQTVSGAMLDAVRSFVGPTLGA